MYPKKANITVIGYPKILQPCQEVAEEYLNSANFLYYQYKAETKGVKYIASSPDHPLERVSKDFERVSHDIIIVGIVTAKEMAGIDKNKIIPFRAGAKPIIKAFMEAKKITDRTAFISPIEEKHDVHFYEKLTGLSIDIYYANTLEDYRTICLQARQEGHSVVVSGSYTFQIAREYGLKPVFLFSDHDIFHDAYSRALEAHRYNQSLEEKVSQLEIISEESQDVVIFVNNDHIVTFTNKVAEHKLGLNIQQIAGRPISKLFDFLENTGFSDKYNQEIIGLFKGEQILVQIHPVFVGGNTAGNILMVKTVKDIAAMDTRIRQKMRPKAFRARYTFRDILGEAPSIKTCIQQARKYALSDAPVLIYGATGTGKELFACPRCSIDQNRCVGERVLSGLLYTGFYGRCFSQYVPKCIPCPESFRAHFLSDARVHGGNVFYGFYHENVSRCIASNEHRMDLNQYLFSLEQADNFLVVFIAKASIFQKIKELRNWATGYLLDIKTQLVLCHLVGECNDMVVIYKNNYILALFRYNFKL